MNSEPVAQGNLLNFKSLVSQTAKERALESEEVYEVIEEAMAWVLNRNNDRSGSFRVKVNRDDQSMQAWRLWEVISDDQILEDVQLQKTYEVALETDSAAQIGGEVKVEVPVPSLDKRANAQIFKQKYQSLLRHAENSKLLDDLLERGERIINGTIKRIDRMSGDYVVEVQRVECRLRRLDSIPKESLRPGDRIRCLIRMIKDDPHRGRLVYLTRTSDEFLQELFRKEVPEIEKGVLEVVGVSREPGYRSKIAVRSRDSKVDPVGTCVGMRGSRVQSVTADLGGEKVDIIPWDEDEITFVLRALAPAEIESARVIANQSCDVIVKEENLAKAIGKTGMNVKLASRLTGWQINIMSPEEAEQREQERIDRKQSYFMKNLDVDELVARILYDEGFNTIDDLVATERKEFLEIEGFDEAIVDEIIERAKEAAARIEKEFSDRMARTEAKLVEIVNDEDILRLLVNENYLTVESVGELSVDDFFEIVEDMGEEEASAIIMACREASGTLGETEAEATTAEDS